LRIIFLRGDKHFWRKDKNYRQSIAGRSLSGIEFKNSQHALFARFDSNYQYFKVGFKMKTKHISARIHELIFKEMSKSGYSNYQIFMLGVEHILGSKKLRDIYIAIANDSINKKGKKK
jgi:hypothetical protein